MQLPIYNSSYLRISKGYEVPLGMLQQKTDDYGYPYMLVPKGLGGIKQLRHYLSQPERRMAGKVSIETVSGEEISSLEAGIVEEGMEEEQSSVNSWASVPSEESPLLALLEAGAVNVGDEDDRRRVSLWRLAIICLCCCCFLVGLVFVLLAFSWI